MIDLVLMLLYHVSEQLRAFLPALLQIFYLYSLDFARAFFFSCANLNILIIDIFFLLFIQYKFNIYFISLRFLWLVCKIFCSD